jgi:hypothetical protein
MRSRSELYDILVDDLRIDRAKATEIIDNAFALHDDETKKRNEKIEELKEKFVGKLLYIDFDYSQPTCIFVNDIKETSSLSSRNYFNFVGPHIVFGENDFHFYSIEDYSLTIGQNEFDKIEVINDMGHIALSKKQFIKQYLYYQLIGKRVETCMNKFIDECKID